MKRTRDRAGKGKEHGVLRFCQDFAKVIRRMGLSRCTFFLNLCLLLIARNFEDYYYWIIFNFEQRSRENINFSPFLFLVRSKIKPRAFPPSFNPVSIPSLAFSNCQEAVKFPPAVRLIEFDRIRSNMYGRRIYPFAAADNCIISRTRIRQRTIATGER